MIIYNGFRDGESKTRTMKPRKRDNGHSMVESTTTRIGSKFAFRYILTCECGRKFSSRTSISRVHQSFSDHLRRVS